MRPQVLWATIFSTRYPLSAILFFQGVCQLNEIKSKIFLKTAKPKINTSSSDIASLGEPKNGEKLHFLSPPFKKMILIICMEKKFKGF